MTTRRRSITKTHERIAQLGWEPSYHEPARRYPTRYRFPNKAKDPMKHIMREYLPMELEKDERVYGGHDAAVRADMPRKAHERWLEILKPFITVTNFAEIGAGRCMSMLMSAVPNNELRNGYHVQFVDEIRHTGMQMSLARWYAKNVPDPAGWNLGPKAFCNSVLTNPGLNMLSHFMVGDPIQCAFTLQVVAETAFTNVVFVALPDVAARNGDFTLPTTYLSVQSDEARHISNGYATLLTVLQDDHNAPLIERDHQLLGAVLDAVHLLGAQPVAAVGERALGLGGRLGPIIDVSLDVLEGRALVEHPLYLRQRPVHPGPPRIVGAPVTLGLAVFCVGGGLLIGVFGRRVADREIATGTASP